MAINRRRALALLALGNATGCSSLPEQAQVPEAGMAYVDFYGAAQNEGYDLWEVFLVEGGKERHVPRALPPRLSTPGVLVLRVGLPTAQATFNIGTYSWYGGDDLVLPKRTTFSLVGAVGKITPVKLVKDRLEYATEITSDAQGRVVQYRKLYRKEPAVTYSPVIEPVIDFVRTDEVPYRFAGRR